MATHSSSTQMKSKTSPGYRVITEALERYIRAAPKLIKLRWQKDLKLLIIERREEAEALLQQPQPEDLQSINEQPASISNEWFLVYRSPTSYFTGRQKHASIVKAKLAEAQGRDRSQDTKMFVICGMGGSGKTQFCLKYAWDNRSCYWGVFWVDASNEENLEAGFASLGQQVGIGPTCAAAMHWLLRCTKSWLLILDNADNPEMDISQYIPGGEKGHILVTTRNPNAIEYATAGYLRFRGMDSEEAVNLLLTSATSKEEANSPNPNRLSLAQGIASELGYLALALTHAGTTISRNIYTLEGYLNYYSGHRRTMMSCRQITSADEANIITTWEIPFQKLIRHASTEHQDAVDLLHIFAFMHFDFLPESIFHRSWNLTNDLMATDKALPYIFQSAWNKESQTRFRRAVRVLYDHSIVDYERKKRSCSLHPVIHSWARGRLDEEQQKRWLRCTVKILCQCISPFREISGRPFRRTLLPHIDSAIRALKLQCPSYPDDIETAAEIESFASVYAENGLWGTAKSLQSKVVSFRDRYLGEGHKASISAQRSLGYIYWNLFEVRKAVDIQRKALNSLWWKRPSLAYWTGWPLWKADHVSYCVGQSDLTLTLWLAGDRDSSKYFGELAVSGLMKRLGAEDPETLTAMFNLARTYLGDYKQSHSLLLWVLKNRRRLFGPIHPDTLMVKNELGIFFCVRKRHPAVAERLISDVLRLRRKVLGEEHAYTLWSANDLSKVLCERGRPEEAAEMLEEVVPVVLRTLGDKHVGMAMTQTNLARAYASSGELEKAKYLLDRLLPKLPTNHPDWFHTMFEYVLIQIRIRNFADAEKDCKKMLEKISNNKILALNHPRTIAIAEELWKLYDAQSRLKDIATLKELVPSLNENKFVRAAGKGSVKSRDGV